MDYNFKRIADVEEIESVSEDTMFLVNDGGVIRQVHTQIQSDGNGSSSDHILENAKETGGFGWTESGEQQMLVPPVTAETQESSGYVRGEFTMGENIDIEPIARLFNETYPELVINIKVNEELYKILGSSVDDDDNTVSLSFGREEDPYPVGDIIQSMYAMNKFNFTLPNTYVEAGITTVSIFTGSETVHTIDPKYISGGAMVVHFEVEQTDDGPILHSDKTVNEVKAAAMHNTISGVLTVNGFSLVLFLANGYPHSQLMFCVIANGGEEGYSIGALIVANDAQEWELHG